MEGVVGYIRHMLLEQVAAAASKVPELRVRAAGIAEVTFVSETVLLRQASALAGSDQDAERTAIYRVHDYKLV